MLRLWHTAHQVAGGCDFVRRTLASFLPESSSTCVLIDLLGYDAWPALAALEALLAVLQVFKWVVSGKEGKATELIWVLFVQRMFSPVVTPNLEIMTYYCSCTMVSHQTHLTIINLIKFTFCLGLAWFV